jgi:transcriptional regulator with PAS, ATPase and Fis domain
MMTIQLPPLREHIDDIPALVSYLLNSLGSSDAVVSDDIMEMLLNYPWPGNIRELRNVLERALLLTPPGKPLHQSHFASISATNCKSSAGIQQSVQDVEEAHIRTVLDRLGGDVDKAAKCLNISRATLYRRLKQFNLLSK